MMAGTKELSWFWNKLRIFLGLVFCSFSFTTFGSEVKGAAAGDQNKTILVVGDSLAAGYGLEPEEAFPNLLQKKIEEANLPFSVTNAGLSGDTSAGGLRRIDWLLKRKVDVLILELGGNDGLRGIQPDSTKTNLQAIITKTKAKYPEARIVIAGMQMPANMGIEYTTRFKDIFFELAKENNAALVPFLLEDVGGKADLNQADRIHPTAEGQKILARNVWKILEPLLKTMQTARNEASGNDSPATK